MNEETKVDETTASASEGEQTADGSTEAEKAAEVAKKAEEEASNPYKQELERLQGVETQLKQAEHIIVTTKKDLKEAKEAPQVDIEAITEAAVAASVAETTKLNIQNRKNDVISKITASSGSVDEAKLIQYHYENTIKVTGDDVVDIENAMLLANKPRYSSNLQEAMASGRSKDTIKNSGGASGSKKPQEEEKIELSDEDKQVQQGFGLTDEQMTRGYDREKDRPQRQDVK